MYHYLNLTPDGFNGLFYGNAFILAYYSDIRKQIEILNQNSGLISSGCSAVFIDREKNIWISNYRGVSKIPSRLFATYTVQHGLRDTEVSAIEEYKPGQRVFGHEGVLTFYDGKDFSYLNLSTSPHKKGIPDRVMDISTDNQGNIYVAALMLGLLKISPDKSIECLFKPNNQFQAVNSVVVNKNNEIFFSTQNGFYEIQDNIPIRIGTDKYKEYRFRKLFTDVDETIIIATQYIGLLEYSDGNWKQYVSGQGERFNDIYGYYKDSSGSTFVGTYGGVCQVINDSLVNSVDFTINLDRPVYLVFKDNSNRFWFGTNNGLYCYDSSRKYHFTMKEGLAGNEINRDACIQDEYGNLWFGTDNGLSRYQEKYKHNLETTPPPFVELDYMVSDLDTLDPNTDLKMPYFKNNLVFHFNILSFIDENETRVQTKLSGFDTSWSEKFRSYDNTVRYNNLPPGKYIFCIKARNAIQKWSDVLCSRTITIENPFYLSWWFILLMLIIAALLIYFLVTFFTQKRIAYLMARQINERTMQLKNSERKLKKLNKTKDKFFSIIAHDLRSPFNSIVGFSEMLSEENETLSKKERLSISRHIYTSANLAFDLLENLLAWARAQEGKIPFNPEVFDVNNTIQENVVLFTNQAHHKSIGLINLSNKKQPVYADVDQVRTVLRNLISNAIKFTPIGGKIVIISRLKIDKVQICIKDTGIGMPDEIRENLFKPDEKIGREGTSKEKGTGLGLILCKEFIEMNNGRIWVNSKNEEGSTFCFTLPAADKDSQGVGK